MYLAVTVCFRVTRKGVIVLIVLSFQNVNMVIVFGRVWL